MNAMKQRLCFLQLGALLLSSGLWATMGAAQQVPQALSLEEAIRIAQENNPGYLAQENSLRTADWDRRVAFSNLLPSIGTSSGLSYSQGGEVRVDDVVVAEQPSRLSSRYSLSLNWGLSGQELLEPSRVRAQKAATTENVRNALVSLESQVTQRYLDVLEAREAVTQSERQLLRTEAQLELAEGRYEVGAGTQLDVRRAEVERGRARISLLQAQNSAANQVLLLAQSMGTSLPEDISLTETFALFDPSWTEEQLLAEAETNSPALAAARAQIDVAGVGVRTALASYYPSFSIGTGISGNATELLDGSGGFPLDFDKSPFGVSFSLSVPIFSFNGLSRERSVAQARIGRTNAEHQLRTEELALEADVRTALRNLETSYATSLLAAETRSIAEEEVQLATERIRFGVAPNLELIEAQARLGEAERDEIASVYQFHRSLAMLEALIGARLER
jgi:outer membrane protein